MQNRVIIKFEVFLNSKFWKSEFDSEKDTSNQNKKHYIQSLEVGIRSSERFLRSQLSSKLSLISEGTSLIFCDIFVLTNSNAIRYDSCEIL